MTCAKSALAILLLTLAAMSAAWGSDGSALVTSLARKVYDEDLQQLVKRRRIRVLTAYSRTNFFLLRGQPRGFEYELLREYQDLLNKQQPTGQPSVELIYIPVPFHRLIPDLVAGKGDIAAAGLTITPQRKRLIAFTEPYLTDVSEIVVSHQSVANLHAPEDLSGRQLLVVKGSSYLHSLERLNRELRAANRTPVQVVPADAYLEAEDILEMVNAGIAPLTMVDRHIAELWSQVFKHIRLHPNLTLSHGGQIAWGVRNSNPQLNESLSRFISQNKKGSLLGNILFKRYFASTRWISNPLSQKQLTKLEQMLGLFQKYGERFGFDPLLLAAQAYQESGLNQHRVSHRGAVGVMQIKKSTAASKQVGVHNIERLENNIHAGTKYLAFLRDRYFSAPQIAPESRVRLSLAAYNAGPSTIARARRRAKAAGLNTNAWFDNVEFSLQELIGSEPVRYVANIEKYYVAYKLAFEMLHQRTGSMGLSETPANKLE